MGSVKNGYAVGRERGEDAVMNTGKSNQGRPSASAAGEDRRTAPRISPKEIPAFRAVKVIAGPPVELVNISRGGALIESEARISPGSIICLRLITEDETFLLKGRVLRSKIVLLQGRTPRYQSAVAFEQEFALLADKGKEKEGTSRSVEAVRKEEEKEVMTVTARVAEASRDLRRKCWANNW